MINKFTKKYPKKSIGFTSLGQLRYLSALKHVDVIIGNSSSGLIEASSFKTATINIGERQKGRIKAKSVIDCLPFKKNIKVSLKKFTQKVFRKY